METKFFPMAIKAMSDDAPGSMTALVSAKGNVDRVGDKIVDGAYANLGELVKDGFGAVGHNWHDLPIATIEDAKEVPEGLMVELQFHDTQAAQDARKVVKERLERGKTVSMSIGYETLKSRFETVDQKQVRVLEKIKVFEASIVTVPANPLALARGAKGLAPGMTPDEQIATLLDSVGDLKSRLALFDRDRGELSPSRRDALKSMAESLIELYEKSAPATPEPVCDWRFIAARDLELRAAGII